MEKSMENSGMMVGTAPEQKTPGRVFINVSKDISEIAGKSGGKIFLGSIAPTPGEEGTEPRRLVRIHIFPIGEFEHAWYGEIAATAEDLENAAKNWRRWTEKGGSVKVFWDHGRTRPDAAGKFLSCEVLPNGLWGTAELTEEAYGKVLDGTQSKFSPEWTDKGWKDDSGEKYKGYFFWGGVITPEPHFATALEGIYIFQPDGGLAKAATRKKEEKKEEKKGKQKMENFLIEFTGTEETEDQKKFLQELKAKAEAAENAKEATEQLQAENEKLTATRTDTEKKVASLERELTSLTAQVVEAQKKEATRDRLELLKGGLAAGKVTKAQFDEWQDEEKSPFADNESLTRFLATAMRIVPTAAGSENGTEAEPELTEEDRKIAKELKIEEKDYARYQRGEVKRKGE